MLDVSADQLAAAIECQHGGRATLVQAVPIHVFDLEGHPQAKRAYAWSSPIDGSESRRFYAVLHGPVGFPLSAVRAAIVADRRNA